jgi:hypothetical protein
MNAKHFSLGLSLALGALLLSSGCEVSTCKGAKCFKDAGDFFGHDSGTDGGATSDGAVGTTDGAAGDGDVQADGGNHSGNDGGSGDAGGGGLTLEDFCTAEFVTAIAWRDYFGDNCTTQNFPFAQRDTFLQLLAYSGDNAIDMCIAQRMAPISAGNTTYDGTKAAACAAAFAQQIDGPGSDKPTDGIDLGDLESKLGHGGQVLVQIPACRAAFKGKLQADAPCTDGFECTDGLRCMTAPGNTKTCQLAIGNAGTCTNNSDCGDGLTCIGSQASGRVCRPANDLGLNGANCTFSKECAEGLVCGNGGKCAVPTADVVCK